MLFVNMIRTGTFLFLFFVSGCMNNPPGPKDKVLARINNFELTAEDFKEEVNPLLMKKYSSYSSLKQKEQVLEELITKEVLLQEAQRLNLDKKKSFMKEIEGYWEQALMKSLINKKLLEFSLHISVNNQEVLEEYGRMKRRISAELVIFNEKQDAQKLSKAATDFNVVKQELGGRVVWEAPADWYSSSDLPQKLESVLFSVKPGEVSAPIEYNGNWVVIRVLKEEPQQIGALEELKPRIIHSIIRKKKEILLENWISELRRKARVKIDRELLKGIDLKEK